MSQPDTMRTDHKGEFDCLPDDVWPIGKKAAFYSLFIVFLLGAFDFIDRQVLAALLPYIKNEWNVSDTELGLLVSIVNIAMSALVIPSAYFIDKWSRKKMIAIMGTIWSLATGACAFAGSYAHLLIARAFVGSGEAGYNPAAQALLSAQFPKKYRGTVLALTQLGLAMGAPLGLVIGAYVAKHWGWRHAFGVVAIPGFILALMALLIKDYKSVAMTDDSASSGVKAAPVSYPKVLARIMRTPSLLCVFGGAVMAMMHSGTTMNWLPSYLAREGGLPVTTASTMAAGVLLASMLCIFLCGPTIDFLRKRTQRGVPLFVACCMLMATLFYLITYGMLTPGSGLQLSLLLFAQFFMGVATASGPILTMELTHPGARATAAGMLIFCQNLLGFSVGPLLTGFLSDHFELGTAILVMNSFSPFIVALCYGICTLTYKRDLAKVTCVNLDFNA